MPEDFRVEEQHPSGANATVLALHGEVDLHVAPELRDRLNGALEADARNLVIDLSRVSFIDSMALGALLELHKRLRAEGGELRLVVPDTKLRRIFEITLLDQIFTLAKTRHEALAAFTSSWGS
ncbi:MAG: STAS domain-containing protein [Actinobacteria bacterium]|nr:STAS domain-containing protein [Actinomycetota bacterium]